MVTSTLIDNGLFRCPYDISQLLEDLRLSSKPIKKRRTVNGPGWDLSDGFNTLHLDGDSRTRRTPISTAMPLDPMPQANSTQAPNHFGTEDVTLSDADDENDVTIRTMDPELRRICLGAGRTTRSHFPMYKQPKPNDMALVPYIPPAEVLHRVLTGKKWTNSADDMGYEGEAESDSVRVLRMKIEDFLAQQQSAIVPRADDDQIRMEGEEMDMEMDILS
eukprot:TRINITY_DN1838_c0_g1_i1.p1 TRINITY_DN1838_c0_g1~~TRINITY_DN1838_c0_g1_i1.p1  ORF type:complete len:227 (-),score=16.13 TRINITY_DN1838_c0_g1_i1:263-919(-)